MLLVEYRSGEQFAIGDEYVVTVVEVRGDEVVLAVSPASPEGGRGRPIVRMPVRRPHAMAVPYLSESSKN